MIKVVYCLRRKVGMPFEEFSSYWHEKHAPLVKQFAGAMNLIKYTQSHALSGSLGKAMAGTGKSSEAFDGVAELWYDSVDDFMAGAATDEGRRAFEVLKSDEEKFIDRENSVMWLAEEKIIYG